MEPIRAFDEEVNQFLKSSEELIELGTSFAANISAALENFRHDMDMMASSPFVEKAVQDMLNESFSRMEARVKSNLANIESICRDGGQWYSFYLNRALGRKVTPPKSEVEIVKKAAGQGAA
ncbi:MAG: hypothetical protein AB1898_09640 [Acidobacteriota bacterium]